MDRYKNIKFKAGIEVHQQLETNNLFCSCPSLVNDNNKVSNEIKRKLRAVAGELGEVDVATLHEIKKGREFSYQAKGTSSCLVELDEEPPHEINKEALDTALEISLLFKANIIDELHVMRKIVIDGSNITGFQRTMLIATDGYVNTSKGIVKIPTIYLEEEAAKKINEDENNVNYSLDRLGVPLVEIDTDASIKDPEHAKEVSYIIGMILRSTEKVKRGIGSIRQDVNLSILDKERIEIKGFQDLRYIPKVIDGEILRLSKLKKIKSEVRRANVDGSTTFLRPLPGAARLYPETDVAPIVITRERLAIIKLPELIVERALEIEKNYDISPEQAHNIVKDRYDKLFLDVASKLKKEYSGFLAETMLSIPKELRRKYKIEYKFNDKLFRDVFEAFNLGKISKNSIFEIFLNDSKGKKINLDDYKIIDDKALMKEIEKIVKEKKDLGYNAIIGIIMEKFKGKVDGKKASEIIGKILK
ncbi:MAG: Glu-tRNA(Gln) amidotransferase subunit GatE [Candidatus Nanoarchaeia archaeon]|nr:Glu-tRNA(Gln) amidotransferase subunit GatE [Candidatus Nanoarchaeia archaeon]